MTRIILASRSPRRRLLLRQIGLRVIVTHTTVDERRRSGEGAVAMVRRLALSKALRVAVRFRDGVVVGADTTVVLRGMVLGKPGSRRQAARMLRLLSGRTHTVHTGVALVSASDGGRVVFHESTRVRFRRISEDEIESYVRTGSPLDKAGAYGIQDDFGAVFVEKVEGCFYNVVGFPLSRFFTELKRFQNNAFSAKGGRK